MVAARLLATLAVALAPATAAPQADAPLGLEGHVAGVRAARVAEFYEAWDQAGADARSEVRELLAGLRSPGAPAEVLPSLGAVEVARRVLAGERAEDLLGEGPAAVLAVQALALDLRVVPGLVQATASGRGANLEVRLRPLFELRDQLDVDLSLIWQAPDGREQLARREPVAASGFGPDGLEMYIRAPLAEPGLWHLVAELSPSGREPRPGSLLLSPRRSRPVPVPLLGDPGALLERAAARPEATLRACLEALIERGERHAPSAFEAPEAWLGRLAAGGPEPTPAAALEADAPRLLFVQPRQQQGAATFAGRLGEAWRVALPDHRLATVAPSPAGEQPHVGTASAGPGEVCLVLTGDAVLATQLEFLRHGPGRLDRLVIVARAWRPNATLPSVPTLYLTPDAEAAELAAAASHVTAVVLEGSVFLAALEVPGHVATWLAGAPR